MNKNKTELATMTGKITALEEYCLNVDYVRIPPPAELQYLFVKTTGTCDFYDNSPDRLGYGVLMYSCSMDSFNHLQAHTSMKDG
jgi:hypothetical protein